MNQDHINTNEDKLLKDLFKDYSPDSPSNDFTKKTMNDVFLEWSKNPIETKTSMSKASKIWISAGVIFAFILVYLIDIKNASQQSETLAESFKVSETAKIFSHTFETIFNSFTQIPVLVYVVIAGIGMVLLLDKLFSKILKPV